MFKGLRRYDVQADYALALAIAGAVPCLAAAVLVFRRYEPELGQIVYGSKGMFLPAFAGCVVLSLLLSGAGFAMGWSSAGQRRNDKQTRSWLGFFVGGSIVTFDLILLMAFVMLRLVKPI